MPRPLRLSRGARAAPDEGGNYESLEVIRGHQISSEVIRGARAAPAEGGNYESLEVIRGHQISSEVIRAARDAPDVGHNQGRHQGRRRGRAAREGRPEAIKGAPSRAATRGIQGAPSRAHLRAVVAPDLNFSDRPFGQHRAHERPQRREPERRVDEEGEAQVLGVM